MGNYWTMSQYPGQNPHPEKNQHDTWKIFLEGIPYWFFTCASWPDWTKLLRCVRVGGSLTQTNPTECDLKSESQHYLADFMAENVGI